MLDETHVRISIRTARGAKFEIEAFVQLLVFR